MDRGTWQAMGSQKGWTQLSDKTTTTIESIFCIIFTDIYDSCVIIQSQLFFFSVTLQKAFLSLGNLS